MKEETGRLIEVVDNTWPDWLSHNYLAAWKCAALSMGFPPTDDVFSFAEELCGGPLFDEPQFAFYALRKHALERAIRQRQIPDLQAAEVTEANPVRWLDNSDRVALVPFVSWAIYEGWSLPPELAAIRSSNQQGELKKKYRGVVPNIDTLFSNQKYDEKRRGLKNLKEAAYYPSSSKRGTWDEYALLMWLKAKGVLPFAR